MEREIETEKERSDIERQANLRLLRSAGQILGCSKNNGYMVKAIDILGDLRQNKKFNL